MTYLQPESIVVVIYADRTKDTKLQQGQPRVLELSQHRGVDRGHL